MKLKTLTIVGVGLIGGSIGLAAKSRGSAQRIIGVGRKRETLETARDLGAIDEFSLDLTGSVVEADLTVFCTPVDRISEQVLAVAPHCPPGSLLTDAGSTKEKLVHEIEDRLPGEVTFVGSHPLAGSEKRGPEHASGDLFNGRVTIVTQTPRTSTEAVRRTQSFWEGIGSIVRVMTPEEHDRALALTSHLPHLAASALAGMLPDDLRDLAATGFRDTTRVASGDPELWTAIFSHNAPALLNELTAFIEFLKAFERALKKGNTQEVDQLLAKGKQNRDALEF